MPNEDETNDIAEIMSRPLTQGSGFTDESELPPSDTDEDAEAQS